MTAKIIEGARGIKVTYRDGSSVVKDLTDCVLEKLDDCYMVFSKLPGIPFSTYQPGFCNLVSVEVYA